MRGIPELEERHRRRMVGSAMTIVQDAWQDRPTEDSTARDSWTVALPWYEEDDFARLCAMSYEDGEVRPTYANWRRQADDIMRRMLASGRAVEIVTVKPGPFLAWLDGAPNTPAARHAYVRELATVRSLN